MQCLTYLGLIAVCMGTVDVLITLFQGSLHCSSHLSLFGQPGPGENDEPETNIR